MISGATRGAGGPALARHLANAVENERVIDREGRGLIATGIEARIAELARLASHARTSTPLYHVHADPPANRPWTDNEREAWWSAFETEFGLEDRPFAAVEHFKGRRSHEHRVYLRIRADGVAIRMDNDYARREKLGRLFEIARGDVPVAGAHNRAVIAALEGEGHHTDAIVLRAAGLHEVPRPRAGLTPCERHRQDRIGRRLTELRTAVLAAWNASDDARSFQVALAGRRLALGIGRRTVQVIDGEGRTNDLRRTLASATRADHGGAITAATVRARLQGIVLPTIEGARMTLPDPIWEGGTNAVVAATDANGPAEVADTVSTRGVDASRTDGASRPPAEGPPRQDGPVSGIVAAKPYEADPRWGELHAGSMTDRTDGEGTVVDVGATAGGEVEEGAEGHIDAEADANHVGAGGHPSPASEAYGDSSELIDPHHGPSAGALARRGKLFAQALAVLDAEATQINSILKREPHPDPASRDPDRIMAGKIAALEQTVARTRATADHDAAIASTAAAAMRWFDRLSPVPIQRRRASDRAEAVARSSRAADEAVIASAQARRPSIRAAAERLATQRQREREAWRANPATVDAFAESFRNGEIRRAILAGDMTAARSVLTADPQKQRFIATEPALGGDATRDGGTNERESRKTILQAAWVRP